MTRLRRIVCILSPMLFVAACDGELGTCEPETDLEYCERSGRDCGEYANFDNCGAARSVLCGTCDAPSVCGGGGTNICGIASSDAGGPTTDAGGPTTDAGGPATDAGGPATDAGPRPSVTIVLTIADNPDVVAGNPSTDAFDLLEGRDITFLIAYDSLARPLDASYLGENRRQVDLLRADFELSGGSGPLLATLSEELGRHDPPQLSLSVFNPGLLTETQEVGFRVLPPPEVTSFMWLEVTPCDVDFPLDRSSHVVVQSYSCITRATLRRISAGTMTDHASGPATIDFVAP